jgi:hypothetical protein
MDLFSVDLTLTELIFLRQASDVVSITGKDAKFLSDLQTKLEGEIGQVQKLQEDKKMQELAKAMAADKERQQVKK